MNKGGIRISDFLDQVYLNNSVETYLWFAGTLVISILVIQLIKRFVFNRLFKWTEKQSGMTKQTLMPVVKKYLPLFLYVNALYLSMSILNVGAYLQKIIDVAVMAIAIYLAVVVGGAILDLMLERYKARNADDENRVRAMRWVSKAAKVLLWIIAVLLFLNNINVEIGALMAGLGVGGIAIAFAAQAILEDVFSYFTIFFDRPFEVGDFVIVGDYLGTIENIGVRTTRVRSLGGELLVFPNKDLTNARMKNYKTMRERRVVFSLGVTYDTPLEKLKAIPEMIRQTVEAEENTRFDRAHFFAYGDSSLKYEIVYYVLTADYNQYMDIQQSINFRIKEVFDTHEIEFAFPTRTLYIQDSSPDSASMLKG